MFSIWKIVEGKLQISFTVIKTPRDTTLKATRSTSFFLLALPDESGLLMLFLGLSNVWRPMQKLWKELRSSLASTASKRQERAAIHSDSTVFSAVAILNICFESFPPWLLWPEVSARITPCDVIMHKVYRNLFRCLHLDKRSFLEFRQARLGWYFMIYLSCKHRWQHLVLFK